MFSSELKVRLRVNAPVTGVSLYRKIIPVVSMAESNHNLMGENKVFHLLPKNWRDKVFCSMGEFNATKCASGDAKIIVHQTLFNRWPIKTKLAITAVYQSILLNNRIPLEKNSPLRAYLKWNGKRSKRNEEDNKQRAFYSTAWKVIVIIEIQ